MPLPISHSFLDNHAAPAPVGFQTRGPWLAGVLYVVVPAGPLLPVAEEPRDADDEGPIWYCITKAKYVGVHLSQPMAINAVLGVPGNAMKSYKTQALAVAAFNEMLQYGMVKVIAA
ncbi:hypothetical protein B0H11DRAFT_2389626 [Mycena galericulata]|nr:hypothetical protein B0H11DRAFT_2389626 [Mycena galericulata]